MKTIIYRNYDESCPYVHVGRFDPFAFCINPVIFSLFGNKRAWVTNCEGCTHRNLSTKNFNYKAAVLGIKLEDRHGNGLKTNSR